jgi:hypothetical protein
MYRIKIYKTINLPVVLYRCETWYLILRVFEVRVLRRISGTKRVQIIEYWRTLHNKELHNIYSSPNTMIKVEEGMVKAV